MQPLDPLSFPLTGPRLIEASAGTGKTYTIATLYIRLLLGHGLETGPLDVDRILVVTFTEAATAELRERIRLRVREALQVFLLGSGDPLLLRLVEDLDELKSWAIRRLRLCLRQMDEAEIYTIHGFCNRLLQRHAFESGNAFDVRFETQDLVYREEALRDFWRSRILPLDRFALEALAAVGLETPSRLDRALRDWSRQEHLRLVEPAGLDLTEALARLRTAVEAQARQWPVVRQAVVSRLETLQFTKAAFAGRTLEDLVADLDRDPLLALVRWSHCLTPAHLREHLHKRARVNRELQPADLEHPFLQACANLVELGREPVRQALLVEAWNRVRERLATLKAMQQVLTPDDLLTQTANALRGPSGERLASQVRSRYPMVMMDEFQDTDPTQYFIFQRLFGDCGDEGGLCLIGDPKQAIYGFRGGDIHTYVQAKKTLQQRHQPQAPHLFTLAVNWRSGSGLVRAVNRLFQQSPDVFLSQSIPFYPVAPSPGADQAPLRIDGEQPRPLTLWLTPESLPTGNKQALQQCLAQATAHQIAHWLNLAAAGRARIGERPLQARDMAVLVRNQQEGALIQQVLREQGIGTVSISRGSIFATQEAVDLYQVLRAVADPGDEQLIHAALASRLFAETSEALHRRWTDDSHWETLRPAFEQYHRLWTRSGVIPMLRLLLREQEAYGRIAGQADWQRRLTNLMHLAELLQQASQLVRGPQGLLRWLEEAISRADEQLDDEQVRLDSDDDLVQVVTIHKSKGLEYPVVFLPFAWSRRRAKLALFHDEEADDRLTLDLAPDSPHLPQADRELLAEDMRLLYVALTRARHQVFLGVAPYQSSRGGDLADSALGRLLSGEDATLLASDQARLRAALEQLQAAAAGDLALLELPAPARYAAPQSERRAARAREFRGFIAEDWRLASFSSLVRGGESVSLPLEGELELTDEDRPADEPETPLLSIRDFAKGARAGTLMHELLEAIDYRTLQPLRTGVHPDLDALVRDKLRVHGYDRERWAPVFCAWLRDVVGAPLSQDVKGAQDLSLSRLNPEARLIEMEFHVPVDQLEADSLRALLLENDPERERVAPTLDFEQVRGQLKGFVDLVCEHQGRYYVLDFKSNHLGPRRQDYHQAAMLQAVRQHQYDLQYLFYALALHRLLRYRLGAAYRYERHFGGVFCLFLRGMAPDNEQPYGVFHQRPSGDLIARLDRLLQTAKPRRRTRA